MLTANHAHSALMGVFGMLGVSFIVFALGGFRRKPLIHFLKWLRMPAGLIFVFLGGPAANDCLPDRVRRYLSTKREYADDQVNASTSCFPCDQDTASGIYPFFASPSRRR